MQITAPVVKSYTVKFMKGSTVVSTQKVNEGDAAVAPVTIENEKILEDGTRIFLI